MLLIFLSHFLKKKLFDMWITFCFIRRKVSSHRRGPIKKLFLKFLQDSQENTCMVGFFIKVAALKASHFIKKWLQHRLFPVNIANFLRTPMFKNICKRLLLEERGSFINLIIQQSLGTITATKSPATCGYISKTGLY